MTYITGETIKTLRERKGMTQKQLAEKLAVSDKAVSKWETNHGMPDISILTELAQALSVSVPELLSGNIAENRNVCANMKRSKFYVCPICGNVIHAVGDGAYSCCGIRLLPCEVEEEDGGHEIVLEKVEDEWYIHLDHPMEREHYISFIAYVTDNRIHMEKLYPQQDAQLRFRREGKGKVYAFCNRHGLYCKSV